MEARANTKQDVLERLRQISPELREMGVERLGLFGSFSRNEARPDSDVDFLVVFAPGRKSFDNFMRLSFRLEDVLQRHVEIVTQESLSPYIGPRILAEAEYVSIDG